MDPENKITDDQLDAMLRDIEVPVDLKSRLRDISESQADREDLLELAGGIKVLWRHSLAFKVVLAASLLAVTVFFAWAMWPRSENGPGTLAEGTDSTESSRENGSEIENVSEHLASLNSAVERVEEVMHRIEVQELEAKIRLLQRQHESNLDRVEIDSMIIALAEQAAIPFGGSEKNVELRMAFVIEQYPGSRGAEIAQNFLNQLAD